MSNEHGRISSGNDLDVELRLVTDRDRHRHRAIASPLAERRAVKTVGNLFVVM